MAERIFKIMLAGDISTGKTSFLTQLIYQIADRKPRPTQNLAFFTLRITNPSQIVQIWDSPGDPRYRFQVISGLSPFKAILIFIDITNEFTLHRGRTFIEQLKSYSDLQIHIIESKSELTIKNPHKRKVSPQNLKQLAESVGGLFFTYTRNDPVQPIIQSIITFKPGAIKKKELAQLPLVINSTNETQNAACECHLY